ncbi:MAG: branched-chain amino acid ABC transporter permease, partial [Burkholderiaceae bacterium]
CVFAALLVGTAVPHALFVGAAILLVVPIGPLVARLALQPIADASMLVLLIAAIALHYLLSGLGLLFFGPEGSRTATLAGGVFAFGDSLVVSGQVLLMLASAVVLSALFFLAFERTVTGKALRATAVNRIGARLVGIRPARTAMLAYGLASLLAGFVGVMVAPVMTVYYDSGFLLSLKAFVAAIIGGLVSYPLTALGALAVGMVESFGSFYSGALKDVIVFSLLIPVLLLRSALAHHGDDDAEEIDG